jgi:hypothetical protein
LNAFDEINKTSSGGNDRTITGAVGSASYATNIMYGGKNNWFVSSEGAFSNSQVIKTALFQGYSGVGLYTVRGQVNASIQYARLSGCDATPTPDCYVPAFIASGTINTGTTAPKACTASGATDGTSSGLYGSPATLNLNQGDLSRIFFKVKCFNKFNNADCTISLLDYLEYDYGRNPADANQDFSFQQTGINANGFGIPVVTVPSLPAVPSVPSSCEISSSVNNLDLGSTTCDEIVLRSNSLPITITGNGLRSSGQPIKIYTDARNPNFSNAYNFTLYTKRPFTVSNASDFTINSISLGTFNNANSNFTLYTTGTTTLNGTVGTTANPFRVVSTNTITAGAGAILTNGTVITGPASVAETNNNTAPQNLVASGNITAENVNIFARKLDFTDYRTVRILNSLVYVYAFACPDCSRASSTSSLNACSNDNRWCGWDGDNLSLNIGRASDGSARPVLFISNNTTVRTTNANGTVYIWGTWYGEDVTYLSWVNSSSQDFRGFLIRNFPPTLTLNINISSSAFRMNFSKPIIDTVSNRYRFFREVECVRDPLMPKAQLIQTRMTSY